MRSTCPISATRWLDATTAAAVQQAAIKEELLLLTCGPNGNVVRIIPALNVTSDEIQAGLTKSAAADIQKQIAELKGGFQVGDLKDNMDKFEDAVNDKVADAKGTVDSVESNPDQILKKAKDSLKSQEIKDELARNPTLLGLDPV